MYTSTLKFILHITPKYTLGRPRDFAMLWLTSGDSNDLTVPLTIRSHQRTLHMHRTVRKYVCVLLKPFYRYTIRRKRMQNTYIRTKYYDYITPSAPQTPFNTSMSPPACYFLSSSTTTIIYAAAAGFLGSNFLGAFFATPPFPPPPPPAPFAFPPPCCPNFLGFLFCFSAAAGALFSLLSLNDTRFG